MSWHEFSSPVANPYRYWNWFGPAALRRRGEAAIVLALIREVMAGHPVDPARIYLVGISAGGALAIVLARCHGATFAACAVHSAVMYRAADPLAEAARVMRHGSKASAEATASEAVRLAGKDGASVPLLVLQGNVDQTGVPMNADQIVEQALALYAQFDTRSTLPMGHVADSRMEGGRQMRIDDYRLPDRTIVRKVLIDALAHAWSGGDARQEYYDPAGPDATRMIWEFLRYLPSCDSNERPGSSVTAH